MEQRLADDEITYYYYDFHPTEEDAMGETALHNLLLRYLEDVLLQLFHEHRCAVYRNLNVHDMSGPYKYPVAPDLAVIKGVDFHLVSSWRVGRMGSAPQVVFEIASDETWRRDLREKPLRYASLSVEEYFAYDPHEPPLPASRARRLYGWRLDKVGHIMREMPRYLDGSIWSPHLQSLLVPQGRYLRLYDNQGNMRLTKAQAEATARRAETQRAEEALRRADIEATARRAETQRAEEALRRADIEAAARQVEARRAEALAEKLRSLGIDPDQL